MVPDFQTSIPSSLKAAKAFEARSSQAMAHACQGFRPALQRPPAVLCATLRSPARQGFQALDIEAVAKLSDVSQVRVFRPTGSII
jgi:hypothetical protein